MGAWGQLTLGGMTGKTSLFKPSVVSSEAICVVLVQAQVGTCDFCGGCVHVKWHAVPELQCCAVLCCDPVIQAG